MSFRLADLAALVGGEVVGDGERPIEGLRTLEDARENHLSFLTHSRYREEANRSSAGALLVGRGDDDLTTDLVVVEDPSRALALLLRHFASPRRAEPGIHPSAVIAEDAEVDPSASIGALCVVGSGALIGPRTRLEPHCVLGEGATVGADCLLHARVTLYDRSAVGDRCILHSGAVVGADGFGYASDGEGHHKLEHLGRTVLEDDVEVGANATLDRGMLGDTVIGAGTKIDDLVMVAHNVRVGRHCLLVAQAGIAGSARLGDRVTVAGQSGIIGHIAVGDDVVVASKSAVYREVEPGKQLAGIPATDLPLWRRQQAIVARLPEWRARLMRLERDRREESE